MKLARVTDELKEALTQLKVIQDRLFQKETGSEVEKISAEVAHAIRNPLTFIGITVQYVADKLKLHDPQRELLEAVSEKVNKVKEATQKLIQFARTYHLDLQPVKIDRVLDKIISLVKSRCAIQNIEVIRECDSNLPEIMVDSGRIEEVIFNLVENAIKSIPDHGTIKIGVNYNQVDTLIIRISDTGNGISEENQRKIFEPFFSTNGSTGLGLFIVKRIVEMHKGRIVVESQDGGGTTFSVILPCGKRN